MGRRMAATAALTAHFSRPWNTENKSWHVVTATQREIETARERERERGREIKRERRIEKKSKYFAPHAKREVNI